MLYSLNILELIEDIKEILKDKSSILRVNMIEWIDRILLSKFGSKKIFKTLLPILKTHIDDPAPDIRDITCNLVGKIKGKYGKEIIGNFMNDIK